MVPSRLLPPLKPPELGLPNALFPLGGGRLLFPPNGCLLPSPLFPPVGAKALALPLGRLKVFAFDDGLLELAVGRLLETEFGGRLNAVNGLLAPLLGKRFPPSLPPNVFDPATLFVFAGGGLNPEGLVGLFGRGLNAVGRCEFVGWGLNPVGLAGLDGCGLTPEGLPDPNEELIPLPLGLPKTFLFPSGNLPFPWGIEFGPFDKVAEENPEGMTFATC